MTFVGRWILGEMGAERLEELRTELDRIDLALAGGAAATIYSPWMSARLLREEQAVHRFPLPALPTALGPQVVADPEGLASLHAYMSRRNFRGLSIIGTEASSFLRVEQPDNRWASLTFEMGPRAVALAAGLNPSWATRTRALCQLLIALGSTHPETPRRDVGRGLSSHLFRGGIFLDPPGQDAFRFEAYVINFAHELGHQALIVYQAADDLIDGSLHTPVYSVIRRSERPAIQSYHAVVAAAYMAEFTGDWLQQTHSDGARRNYLKARLSECVGHIENGIRALSALRYTELGQQILDEMLDLAAHLRGRHAI